MLAELQHISKQYARPVLKDISLTVWEGDLIAITGPSGSGKSTLLNILGTLDRLSSGKVVINGQAVETMKDIQLSKLRNRVIGFVFQAHYLLPQLSLIENVLLPLVPEKEAERRKKAEKRALELLERVGLSDHYMKHPAQLSIGECQRAAVVRALINEPSLLLADEPTGSLDEENAGAMASLLTALNREQKVAMVVVTHSPELAGMMERKFRLKGGRLHPLEEL